MSVTLDLAFSPKFSVKLTLGILLTRWRHLFHAIILQYSLFLLLCAGIGPETSEFRRFRVLL